MRRRSRARARGFNIIEIMIVVAIIGLLAASVVVGVIPQWRKAQVEITRTGAGQIRKSALLWHMHNGDAECPTAERLRAEGMLDEGGKTRDAWGARYLVQCEQGRVKVTSWGPDGRQGTPDDIVEPQPEVPEK